jgi:hypothetical protein
MTAAMNPHEIPVADPSTAARWDRHHAPGDQAGQQPGGAGRVQPPAGRGGQPEEHADPGGHARHGQPVAQLRPPRPGHGQVAEHEQQLGRQDRLNQGQFAEPQRGQLEHEPADHGGDAQQPGRLAGQPDHEPGVEPGRRAGIPGPGALAHRRRRGAQARRDRQQDRLIHQPAPRPRRFVKPFTTTGAAAVEAASVTDVPTAHCAIMFLSVSAGPGRANGAIRRFLVGLPPGTSGV